MDQDDADSGNFRLWHDRIFPDLAGQIAYGRECPTALGRHKIWRRSRCHRGRFETQQKTILGVSLRVVASTGQYDPRDCSIMEPIAGPSNPNLALTGNLELAKVLVAGAAGSQVVEPLFRLRERRRMRRDTLEYLCRWAPCARGIGELRE